HPPSPPSPTRRSSDLGPYSRGARCHWSHAPAAELFTAFVQESAGWARQRDREPTLAAEAAPGTVLSVAARALHRGPPPRPRTLKDRKSTRLNSSHLVI